MSPATSPTGASVRPAPGRRPARARALGVLPGGGSARRAAALVERNARGYRHGWLLLVSGFLEPVLYLAALGVGVGSVVGEVTADDGSRVPYALFVAPALLAASAMTGAVYDATFGVCFKLRYARTYESVLATPVGPRELAAGEIAWVQLRGLLHVVSFLAVAAVAGLVPSWWALLAVPAGALVSLAFAAVGMAATTWMRGWEDFEWVQVVTLPLFLLSATFFPLTTYPPAVRSVVEWTPLHQGVALVRGVWSGDLGSGLLAHVVYLLVLALLGAAVAARRVERLLPR